MRRLPASLAAVGLVAATTASDCGEQAECGDCYPEGYRVEVIASLDENDAPPAVLYSGYRNGSCQDDMLCTGTPDAFLGDLDPGPLNWRCDAEKKELVVFAGGHTPTTRIDPPASGVSVTLAAPTTLRVAAWVLPGVEPSDDPIGWFGLQLEEARRIMDDLGTGITVDYRVKPFPPEQVGAFETMIDGASCPAHQKPLVRTTEDPVAGALHPAFDPGSLNVYYVRGIDGGWRGLTCFYDDELPYVIFVSNLSHTPAVTAHELGHALGIQAKAPLPSGEINWRPGDVDDLELVRYFPEVNLMRSGVTEVKQITVGEIYRMHFDRRSWLRRGNPVVDGYPRECQASPILGGPCPPLTLQPPRGWP
jgi:hypothetical protein